MKKLLASLSFPLFIKPINLCGSRNTKKINNDLEFHQWASTNTVSESFEIDNFIEGTIYHCDSYIKNNEVLFTLVCQNSLPCYDFTIGKIKGTIALPSSHQDTILLLKITKKILVDLGMPNSGVTHLELIKTKDNKIYFIEIAHRAPGCLIPKMHQAHANLDPISAHYLLQIDPDYHPIPEIKNFSAWACYPKIPGVVINLKLIPKTIKSICKLDWKVRLGEKITTYSQSGRDYTGTIFMINKDFNTLFKEFLLINENNLCEIQPTDIN